MYKIIIGTSTSELEAQANKLIAVGWKPQGGVSSIIFNNLHHLMQAFVLGG